MYGDEFVLLAHPTFGALAIMAAVWVFVETLNVGPDSVIRLRRASYVSAILMWLTFVVGGYWYVTQYGVDKAVIKAGPWPFAHGFFMETKEHIFLMLLLLATFLPIAASSDLIKNAGARKIVLWAAGLVVLVGFALEGSGALISMGTKVGLMAQPL